MIEKIKQKIMQFLGLDKIESFIIGLDKSRRRANSLISGLRLFIGEVNILSMENRNKINELEERIKELEKKTNGVDAWTREEYEKKIYDLLCEHKKWLEINGLVKAPNK